MNRKLLLSVNFLFPQQPQVLLNKSGYLTKWLCLVLLLLVNFGYAQKTWNGSSSTAWNAAANWAPTGVPTNGDDVIIPNVPRQPSITSSSPAAVCGNLTINSGATLTVNQALTVSGTTTISGTLAYTSNNGAKRYTGLVTISLGGTWNNTASSPINFRGGITNNGTFSCGTGVQTFDTNSQILTGTLIMPNVTVTGAGVTLTNTNTLTVSTALSGTGTLTQGTTGILNIGGASGISGLNPAAIGNTVNYTGTAAQSVRSTTTYYNLAFSGNSTKTAAGNLIVNNDFTLSTGTFVLNNNNKGYALTVKGDYIQNGGLFDFNSIITGTSTMNLAGNLTISSGAGSMTTVGAGAPNGNIVFNGSGIQVLTIPTAQGAMWVNYSVSPGSSLLLASNIVLVGENTTNGKAKVIVNNGGKLDMGINTISTGTSFANGGDFTLNAGGTLITAHANGINGAVSSANTSRTFNVGANYAFNGSTAQTTSLGMPTTVNNLIISNPEGVTLTAETTITKDFSITAGSFANLRNFTHTASTLTLGGASMIPGSWGATVSPATNENDTYFASVIGIVNITCTAPSITVQPQSRNICENTGTTFSVATSVAGATFQWQYSPDGVNWTNVDTAQLPHVSGYTTNALTLINTPLGWSNNRVRCVVTSNGCSTNSTAVLLTVNPLPTTPTVGAVTHPTCIVTTGSIALSGLLVGGTLKQIGTAIQSYSITASSMTIPLLASGTYQFAVDNGTCTSTVTAGITIKPQPEVATYRTIGGWSSTPTIEKSIIFANNYNSGIGTVGNLEGCSCTVNSGVNVVINSGATLTITNSVEVNTALNTSLTFENNASLVQTTNATNKGDIIYKRISSKMKALDYTYWSSPVLGQKLNGLSPNSDPNKFYFYNNGWQALGASNPMVVGKGYIIRVPKAGTWPGETVSYPYAQPVAFKGVPNNGIIQGETITAGNVYLVGNPYPSAIDADKFILDVTNNAITKGTLYFWTHNTAIEDKGSQGFVYTSDDYASYNITGGTVTKIAATTTGNKDLPTGKIAAGQSFMLESRGAGTIAFNNGMRVAGENSQFFRPSKTAKASGIEKNRVWLNLINAKGAFKQILVGYIEGATNGEDNNFDGASFNLNSFIDFYSINDEKNYSIQGRALPFTDSDQVPLGYSSTIKGDFTIEIDNADGSLSSQVIYLEDKTVGTIHNLTQAGYTFKTAIGTFDDRFVLRYTNKTLGTGEFETAENAILVSVANKEIRINAISQTIDKVFIYDVTGKLIYKKDKVENPKLVIENLKSSNQVLLVKVVLDNKHTQTKKIIF
jgi:hypothetical protein